MIAVRRAVLAAAALAAFGTARAHAPERPAPPVLAPAGPPAAVSLARPAVGRVDHPPWRHAEARRLRLQYLRLEMARARFASEWHRPREVRRFERWYAWQRAELDRRWAALWGGWRIPAGWSWAERHERDD